MRVFTFSAILLHSSMSAICSLARDAFLRTNRRAIAMMFVRPSICLERACIVIIRCTLVWI